MEGVEKTTKDREDGQTNFVIADKINLVISFSDWSGFVLEVFQLFIYSHHIISEEMDKKFSIIFLALDKFILLSYYVSYV